MKTFLSHNWYKLMIASSFLIFSIGFLLYAISPSYANTNEEKVNTPSRNYVNVPVNADGSINIKISEEQMSEMTGVQDVILAGWKRRPVENIVAVAFSAEGLPVR